MNTWKDGFEDEKISGIPCGFHDIGLGMAMHGSSFTPLLALNI
jgi:hypothetical protein